MARRTFRTGYRSGQSHESRSPPPITQERKVRDSDDEDLIGYGSRSARVLSTYYKRCDHDGQAAIVTVGDISFGGAAGREIDPTGVILVIDLAGTAKWLDKRRDCSFPSGFEEMSRFVNAGPPRMAIDWPDQGVPPVRREFFEHLPDMVKKVYPDGGHVVINCLGGHGRTGTALAALYVLHHKTSAEEAIDRVRALHCKESVESQAQITWLCELAGRGERCRK